MAQYNREELIFFGDQGNPFAYNVFKNKVRTLKEDHSKRQRWNKRLAKPLSNPSVMIEGGDLVS